VSDETGNQGIGRPESSDLKADDGLIEPTDEVVKTVTESYYTRGITAADRMRDGANRGYTIASAVAAALVAAGAFAGLGDDPLEVQVAGVASLVAWLFAAALFVWVVSYPARTGVDPGWRTAAEFVNGVVTGVEAELVELRKRLKLALGFSAIAAVLTAAALGAAVFDTGGEPTEQARLTLTAAAAKALKPTCPQAASGLYGTVDPDELDDDVVDVEVPKGQCGAGETTVRLPGDQILAQTEVKGFPGVSR
jgi:hypothetical protein